MAVDLKKRAKKPAKVVPAQLTPAQRRYLMERIDEEARDRVRARSAGAVVAEANEKRKAIRREFFARLTAERLFDLWKAASPETQSTVFSALVGSHRVAGVTGEDAVRLPSPVMSGDEATALKRLKDEVMLGAEVDMASVTARIGEIFR